MKTTNAILTTLFILFTINCVLGQDDYIMGIVYYNKKYGTDLENAQSRERGFQIIKNAADKGSAYAQYYLATIHLSDTLHIDSLRAIELLKKSAFQRNQKAIKKLDELNVLEYEVQLDYRFWKRIVIFGFILFLYFILSLLASKKIGASSFLTTQYKKDLKKQVWLFPFVGALIGYRKSNKIIIPIDLEDLKWVIQSFDWIKANFPTTILSKSVMTPKDFNDVKSTITKNEAEVLVKRVASIMDIKKGSISVDFYTETRSQAFDEIEIRQFEEVKNSTGKYYGKNKKGIYEISLEESLLKRPINLIATISHELAHVKLLGEERILENDEYLTDLIPIVYGLGIFGANSIFNIDTNNYYWSMDRQGYLDEKTYAFALAWYSSLRSENNPIWKKALDSTVLDEFEKSIVYIENELKHVVIGKDSISTHLS